MNILVRSVSKKKKKKNILVRIKIETKWCIRKKKKLNLRNERGTVYTERISKATERKRKERKVRKRKSFTEEEKRKAKWVYVYVFVSLTRALLVHLHISFYAFLLSASSPSPLLFSTRSVFFPFHHQRHLYLFFPLSNNLYFEIAHMKLSYYICSRSDRIIKCRNSLSWGIFVWKLT